MPPCSDMSIHEPILMGLIDAPTSFRRSISLSGAPTFQKKSTIFWMNVSCGPAVLHESLLQSDDTARLHSMLWSSLISCFCGMLSYQI